MIVDELMSSDNTTAPLGVLLRCPPSTSWDDLDHAQLEALALEHRLVVIRGVAPWRTREEMVDGVRRFGSLQAWSFGGVHDLKVDAHAENYLYTTREVPLHWDGAFASEAPRWLVFHCVEADDATTGGETVFVDAGLSLRAANEQARARWSTTLTLRTEKKAYYGGTVRRDMVAPHPVTQEPVLRFAEPVDDLNPVQVNVDGDDGEIIKELSEHLRDPRFRYAHRWQAGDIVIADNDALLHGRNAFAPSSTGSRRIWRANVLNRQRPWWQAIADAWRIRRPEFIKAELPILLIPAALLAPSPGALIGVPFLALAFLFALLLQIGDVVNCYADRDADRVFKTHLSEAVRRLGKTNIVVQLIVMVLLLLFVSLALWLLFERPFWIPLGTVVGGALAALYSVGPLPMKRSGVFQLDWYVILLFVGPMTLVSGAFLSWPSLEVLLVAVSFGLLQSSVLLVNNAEDLREDRDANVLTASVALGRERVFTVALAVAALGLAGLLLCLWPDTVLEWAAGLCLVVSGAATVLWIAQLRARCAEQDIDAFDRWVKKSGRWVPRFLTSNAWAALALALASRSDVWFA